MARTFVIILDSVGFGGAPDASDFGDAGANTLGHIAEVMAPKGWRLPALASLGLGQAAQLATGEVFTPLFDVDPIGRYAALREHSIGKDTPSGHWELSGVPVPWDWYYFPNEIPAFGRDVLDAIFAKTGVELIGNLHASGTEVIDDFGVEHVKTGKPIAYTSVDSVFQIAAHEEVFGLENLYALCSAVAEIVHPMRVGRVIARPFVGVEGHFKRTHNRQDFAIAPPEKTMLDHAQDAGRETIAIGKIGDIFAHRGIGRELKGGGDRGLMTHLKATIDDAPDGALVFANFVEFDSEYGHRRDVAGYAAHLSWFDIELAEILPQLRAGDMVVISADHGNDPTWRGTDHTREMVPALFYGTEIVAGSAGLGNFVDLAASVHAYLGLPKTKRGRVLLDEATENA